MSELTQRVRALAEKATPGPWEVKFEGDLYHPAWTEWVGCLGLEEAKAKHGSGVGVLCWPTDEDEDDSKAGVTFRREGDKHFIAAMREAAPALCSEIERLERELAERTKERDERQRAVHEWCAAAFGTGHAASIPQRAIRLLEETIEAYQAAQGDKAMAHKLVDFVFGRPVGDLGQELGGIGVCVLALAQAAQLSADDEEAKEFARVLSKPLVWFHARNEAKNNAGFVAEAYPSAKAKEQGNG